MTSLVPFKKTILKQREGQKADCKEPVGECEIRKWRMREWLCKIWQCALNKVTRKSTANFTFSNESFNVLIACILCVQSALIHTT